MTRSSPDLLLLAGQRHGWETGTLGRGLSALPLYSTLPPRWVGLVKGTEEDSCVERNGFSQLAVASLPSPSPAPVPGREGDSGMLLDSY